MKKSPRIFIAGRITGVEGYVESSAMGLMASLFMADEYQLWPVVTSPGREGKRRLPKRKRWLKVSERTLEGLEAWMQ